MAQSIYRKLTRRHPSLFGYSQLWLATDHLLLVKSTRFAEQYQRFALSDIQAITITESPDRIPLQIAGIAAAALWTAIALTADSFLAKYFFTVTGAAVMALLLIDIFRGPRCRCHITTAVSRELLAPVSRMRGARSFLAAVQPAIEAVQGALGPASELQIGQSGFDVNRPPEVPAPAGYLPETVFALLLVDALLILFALRYPRTQTEAVLPTTFFAEIVLVIVALIRRGRHDPRRATYALLLAALIGLGWDVRSLSGWGTFIIQSGPQADPMAYFSRAAWQHNAAISALWRVTAGATGIAAAIFERASR